MQKRTLILLLLVAAFVVPQLSFAQRNLEKGNRLFDMNQYKKAIPFFEKDMNSDDKAVKLEATFRLADCYRLLGDFENAEKIYKKLINKGGGKEAIFQYALALKAAAKYYEAKKEFINYTRLAPEDPRGYMNAKSCDFAQQMLDAEPMYDVRELKTLNTENVDIAPVYYKGGVVFSSQRQGGKKPFVNFEGGTSEVMLDLYYMDFDGTEASLTNKIYFLPGLNTNLHEGPATFSTDGREIYFTRTVEGERLNKTDKVVQNTLQIFYSKIEGDTAWSKPVSAFSFNSIEYSVHHPCITKDGKRLFFSSNMPNGFGGTDLYVVYKQKDGSWSEPFNLGPDVNTTENELYPYYDNKGNLYFSSNGHPGMGKLDIFKSTYDSLYGWTFVENMKVPINSIGDDICYVESENSGRGFLVSNRINGTGGDDIYAFTKKQPFEIEIDQKYLRVKNNTAYDGLTFSIKIDGEKTSTDLMEENGYFIYEPASEVKYVLTARKDGFLNNQVSFSIKNNDDGSKEMEFKPKLEDVYVKAFIGKEKESLASNDSVVADSAAPEKKQSFLAKRKQKKASGKEFPFNDLLNYKKANLRENMLAYKGVQAQHFIEDEFVEELLSDASGEIVFQTAASQSNKITIAAVPENAKPAEKVEEVVEQTPVEIKDDLGWYKSGEKIYAKVRVTVGGEVKRNATFVLKKDGEDAGTVQTDADGNLKLNSLEYDGLYSLAPLNDDQTVVKGFNPMAELAKNTKDFPFVAKTFAISRVLLDHQIEYDEIKVEELFLTIPAGDAADEKVLGQIIFNGKKLKGLEVEILVDGKSKTLAKTARNSFFVAYMNPKYKNALQFEVNQNQYRVPLTEKDFKKRKKYFELVISVDDAQNYLWVDDLEMPNVKPDEVVAPIVSVKEELKSISPKVEEKVTTVVEQKQAEAKNENAWTKNGDLVNGKVKISVGGEVKKNTTFILKKEGESASTIQSDAEGNINLTNLKSDASYKILPANDENAMAKVFNPTTEMNSKTTEIALTSKSDAVTKVLPDVLIEYDEKTVDESFLTMPAAEVSDEKVVGQVIFNNKKLKGLNVDVLVDDNFKFSTKTKRNKYFVAYMNPKKNNVLQFEVNHQQYRVALTEKDFKKRRKYFEVVVSVDDAKNLLLVDDLELLGAKSSAALAEVIKPNEVAKVEAKPLPAIVSTPKENVSGIVTNGKTLLFDAEVKIFEEGEFVAKTKTDAQGQYTFAVKPDAIYTITVGKEGFKYEQKTFTASLLKENTGKVAVDFSMTYLKPVTISGQVMADNKPVADASVDVYKDDAVVKKTKTDTLGNYEVELREREKYTLSITKSGFFQSNTVIETKPAGDSANNVDVKVKLAPIEENKSVSIPNIYFEYNHWKLTNKSIVELDRLVVFLNQNPQIKVLQIFAYTDNVGSDEYNLVLSQKRANTVLEYLIKKGVPRQKLLATGMGERDLIIKNAKSEEEHAKNRRTEFKVTLQQQ